LEVNEILAPPVKKCPLPVFSFWLRAWQRTSHHHDIAAEQDQQTISTVFS